MAISTLQRIFTIAEEESGFASATIDANTDNIIPLYIPSIMTYIKKGTPEIVSVPIEHSNVYINSLEVPISVGNSVKTRNFIAPILENREALLEQCTRADGIIIEGSRVQVHCRYETVREIVI